MKNKFTPKHSYRKTTATITCCLVAICGTLSSIAQAQQCTGRPSQHLNQNYPARALVVSVSDLTATETHRLLATIFDNNTLESTPNILLLGLISTDEVYKKLRPEHQRAWDQKITIDPISVTWAQDFFESFIDHNGDPIIRLVKNYKKESADHFTHYLNAQNKVASYLRRQSVLNLESDQINKNSELGAKNGFKGGNIESTNEGFCLIGDSDLSETEWLELANQNCGGAANTIKLPTSWLPAKHVDELVKQMPENSGSTCNPRFAIASPTKALELLKSKPLEVFFRTESESNSIYMYDRSSYSDACARVLLEKGHKETEFNVDKMIPRENWQPISPSAGSSKYKMPFHRLENDNLYQQCMKINNAEILELFNEVPFYKDSVQLAMAKINQAKQSITTFYRKQRPDCRVDFIEIPALFIVQKSIYKIDGQGDFQSMTSEPFLPNAINSLTVNNDVFIANTGNRILNEYIETRFRSNGLRPTFLDTFRLHVQGGNIHCASQTVHSCR